MGTIYLKELRTYFKSIFGWLFLAVYTAFCSLYFVIYNLLNGSPYIANTVSSLVVVLMFVFPLLTMRVLAEEKKLKTDQLLLTSPVKVSSIILGKFFALITMMLIASLVLLLGLLIMQFYGEIPFAESLLAILALFLVGALFASVGLFLSSLTEHQFIAAILTYGAFIFIMLVPSALQMLFSSNKVIKTIASSIDFLSRYDNLLTGIISATDLFYIVSVIAIFLILAARVFGKSSLQVSLVGAKKFWFSTLGLIAVIVIIIGANVGVSFIPSKYVQTDLTKKKYYSLTDESKNLLKSLNQDVYLHVLDYEENTDRAVKLYLNDYDNASSHIIVKYHNPAKEAGFYKGYTDEAPSSGSIIVESGDRHYIVDSDTFYVKEYSMDYQTYQYVENETGVDIEGQITAAINYVISDQENIAYIVEGHGEVPISSKTADRMKRAGFTTKSLNLLAIDSVPEDCKVLIVNGPNGDLSKEDIEKLQAYVDRGGEAVFMAAADVLETPNYDKFLSGFGATIEEGTIWEDDPMYNYNGMGYYIVVSPVAHEISNSLYSAKKKNLLVECRGFRISEEEDVNISVEPLYESSSSSVAVILDEDYNVVSEDNLTSGPFCIGFYSEKTMENETSKVTVIGTPVFLNETLDAATSYANTELFVNALNYMCDMTLNTSVPAKEYSFNRILVSQGLVFLYAGLLIVVLPLGELVAGIVITIIRRRK